MFLTIRNKRLILTFEFFINFLRKQELWNKSIKKKTFYDPRSINKRQKFVKWRGMVQKSCIKGFYELVFKIKKIILLIAYVSYSSWLFHKNLKPICSIKVPIWKIVEQNCLYTPSKFNWSNIRNLKLPKYNLEKGALRGKMLLVTNFAWV